MINEVNPKKIRQARNAKRVASALYRYLPRVRLVDVGEQIESGEPTGQVAVRVHVLDKPRGATFEAYSLEQPQQLIEKRLIPFDVVDIIQADYRLQWTWAPPVAASRRAVFNPLEGGISTSCAWLYGSGTLGSVVRDLNTREEMLLSNWHVIAGSAYAPKGLRIFQPGAGDGGWYAHTIARLDRHAMVRGIDAAVAELTDNREWINQQFEVGAISGLTYPTLGMRVVKSGRGSDVTYGVVDGIEGDFPIYYGGLLRYIHHVIRIVPQAGQPQVSAPGDSGSLWLEEDSHTAVALHFAGYNQPETALAISLPEVLAALDVELAL